MPTNARRGPRPWLLLLLCLSVTAAVFVGVRLLLSSPDPTPLSSTPSASFPTASSPSSSSAPASSAPAGRRHFSFVGTWERHTASLVIRPDHTFTIETEGYNDCSSDSTTACPAKTPDTTVTGTLTRISGVSATGRITHTNKPSRIPLGRVSMRYDKAHDAIVVNGIGDYYGATSFCGAYVTPPGWCGA
ncbi:hypothetical protein [Streptomyces shenzhenensis]|uniref:hypothetical protein n=1 Tax=Streptomyces shenzhenensis TaxID=943815 RepID=UPI0015F0A290|nr:hypothetical protein [Streptomyces shenzhenensis]